MKKRKIIVFLLIMTGIMSGIGLFNEVYSSQGTKESVSENENNLDEKEEEENTEILTKQQNEVNAEKVEKECNQEIEAQEKIDGEEKQQQQPIKPQNTKPNIKNKVDISSSEKKDNHKKVESNSEKTTQAPKKESNISVKFYESITGGKKEFSSESEAMNRGTEIMNKELDYVLDYNEAHPDDQIQPDINYFRVYPSVIDENGKYWYYLHFFCQSGENNDEKLKKLY